MMTNTKTFEIIICDVNSKPSLKMGEYLLDKEKGIMYVGSDMPIERVTIKALLDVAFGATFRSSLQKLFTETIIDIDTAIIRTSFDADPHIIALIKFTDDARIQIGYGSQIPHLSASIEKV